MELLSAARKAFLADPTIAGYVQGKVYKYRLEQKLDGTGGMAVVLRQSSGWMQTDARSSQRYPLLTVRCYADPTRDRMTGAIMRADAEDKALALHRAVDNFLFQRGDAAGQVWGANPDGTGGLLIIDRQQWSSPLLVSSEDDHDDYGPTSLGDVAYWQTDYAITCSY